MTDSDRIELAELLGLSVSPLTAPRQVELPPEAVAARFGQPHTRLSAERGPR
jgi:hypothetical protein